jgi:amino acid transporter
VALTSAVALGVSFVSIGVGGSAFTLHRLFSTEADHAPLLAIARATGQPVALWGLCVAAVVACAVGIHRLIHEASDAIGSMARMGDLPSALGAVLPVRETPVAALPVGLLVIGLAVWSSPTALIAFSASTLLASFAMRLTASHVEGDRSRPLSVAALVCVALAVCVPRAALGWACVILVLGFAAWYCRDLWKTGS